MVEQEKSWEKVKNLEKKGCKRGEHGPKQRGNEDISKIN